MTRRTQGWQKIIDDLKKENAKLKRRVATLVEMNDELEEEILIVLNKALKEDK
tara:strand:+ start:37 stop:195 length:159 start_codon:yes stop_codon:yes gene_type:complete